MEVECETGSGIGEYEDRGLRGRLSFVRQATVETHDGRATARTKNKGIRRVWIKFWSRRYYRKAYLVFIVFDSCAEPFMEVSRMS